MQPDTKARFQTTCWRLVREAQSSPTDLERLVGSYWSPVYAYIRRSGRPPADAADLTQEFFSIVVLQRSLLEKAEPQRGRFRTFLLSALRNFLVDQHRRAVATRRSPPGGCIPRDPQVLAEAEADGAATPEEAFDRLWAARILSEALERVEADCREGGLERQWKAFEATVVGPAIRGGDAAPLNGLVGALGAETPEQVSNMVQTVKRRFRRTLREVLAETVEEPADVDEELSQLRLALG